MYLVSIYFDDKTNRQMQAYINAVAQATGNDFMVAGNVPPHITISAFETSKPEKVILDLTECFLGMQSGTVQWASIGVFLPYVIYAAPVLNKYLHGMSKKIYRCLDGLEEVSVSNYYRPLQWMPHTTIGKKLSKEEMQIAFEVLQNQFGRFQGQVVCVGLARTNPYEDVLVCDLERREVKKLDKVGINCLTE